jgi:hypothetical protein
MSLTKFVGLLAGSTLTLTGVSYGAAEANNDTTAQINQLKAEIAQMKAAQGDQWLTEQRAEQIRGVVQDVLADSSTRSSFQQAGGATSGYDNGFFLSSADGNYKLKINALEQVRFVWGNGYGAGNNTGPNAASNNQWGFENRRTQVFFSGNVVDPSWKYLVGMAYDSQIDPYVRTADSFQILYAQVTKTLGNGFSVTVGQQNVAFTLQSQLFNAGMTQFGEYSLFEYAFGAGQQVGISAKWESDMVRAMGGYYNAIYLPGGSTPANSWNAQNNQGVALAGRAEVKLAGTWDQFSKESSFKGEEFGLMAGGGIFWQTAREINSVNDPAALPDPTFGPYGFAPVGITVDATAKFGGFNLIGQLLWQNSYAFDANSNDASTWGFNIQGGAFVTEDLEVFGAWNYNTISREAANYVQVGANWYFAKNSMKMTVMGTIPVSSTATQQGGDYSASYGLLPTGVGGGTPVTGDNFGLVVQLQLMF